MQTFFIRILFALQHTFEAGLAVVGLAAAGQRLGSA